MNSIYLFLLKSVLVSGVLVLWYWLGLRNKRLHNYNRFYLLFALCASITVPLLHFQWFTLTTAPSAPLPRAFVLLQSVNDNSKIEHEPSGQAAMQAINWNAVVFSITALISLALLVILVARILWVMRLARNCPKTSVQGIGVIHTDVQKAPFSFLRFLFWKNSIPLESENGKTIFRHELTHIRQKHTYDKLACQLLTCLFWFNPFYWLIQKELNMIHEFIADENAIAENDTEAFAKMLLQTHNNGSYLIPEHQFFSSPIKRRIIMLQTTSKTRYALLRQLLLFPLVAGAIMIFSFTPLKSNKIVKAEKKIVLVVDAGHGGLDAGAQYNGLKEKDLNLRVANKLKELAPEYNIEAHLIRSSDEYILLAERVNISNKLHPDDFISVHVNNVKIDPKTDIGKGNFDIWINMDNPQTERSKELGWAIFQNMTRIGGKQRNNWQTHERIYVCTHNNAPSVLMELGDIKNKEQMDRLTNDDKLTELCNAILKGVVESHGN
jgi:N-acetylmuramoyl-L-alanine amidase